MTTLLPSLFVSHGAPTFALEPGPAGCALHALGALLPRPRAVLVLSPPLDHGRVGDRHPPATAHHPRLRRVPRCPLSAALRGGGRAPCRPGGHGTAHPGRACGPGESGPRAGSRHLDASAASLPGRRRPGGAALPAAHRLPRSRARAWPGARRTERIGLIFPPQNRCECALKPVNSRPQGVPVLGNVAM